ncbi:MAG: hypothetical protein K1X53_09005 [Candidatus Sumerlaeaceae bacterium]|nr:hypothetical protein [Candidatus Sumerlaeaceae bacterium]
MSLTSYYGRYYFVSATRGVHDEAKHEQDLKKALSYDPSHGYANLALARLMLKREAFGGALQYQQQGMESFLPLRGYVQMGTILEKLGRAKDAEDYYNKAVRMDPSSIEALERLALLAFRAQDSVRLESLASEIRRLDLNNVNSLYLLARDAERTNNLGVAYQNYQNISFILSRKQAGSGALLFKPEDIGASMTDLREKIASK